MSSISVKEDFMKLQRIMKGLSIRKLAEIANLNAATIQKIESEYAHPTPATAKKICRALGVEFNDIFEITD